MAEIDQLVKMANQIAANFSFHEDGVQRLADHLQRFWAPAMRKQLLEHAQCSGNAGLETAVVEALQRLPAA
jgi:formate dehydrogenase subunit delta